MPRIISPELNKKLKKEYILRFFSAFFVLISIVVVINIVFISSSYLLLSLYEKAYANNNSTRIDQFSKNQEIINKKIEEVDSLAKKVSVSEGTYHYVKIMQSLKMYAENTVDITGLEIIDEDGTSKIVLRGNGSTRESVLNFQNAVKQNSFFKDFTIPIEMLAKQKDVYFTVTFTYDEK